jgi:hypothetical protein
MQQRTGTQLAVLFEGGLAVVGLLLAWLLVWWLDLPLWERIAPTRLSAPDALARGVLATLPMLAAFFAMWWSRWPPLVNLRERMVASVRVLLAEASVLQLALVATLAGVGEEIVFRGVLQPLVAHWTTPLVGLAVASLLFGLAHCLSWLYFVVAAMIGLYFGWMADQYNEILAPAVAHGLYDFVALVWVLKRR